MRKAFKWIFAILVIASVFCGVGCKDKVEVELKPTKQYGTVKGKAFYSNDNVDNHSGIQITLVATDGLRSVAYCESRGIATNARSVSDIKTTSEDGSYSFENIPVGTYTIWASSRNSVEEAIETNVNVRANEVVTAKDLNLVATGNVKGTITIDGKTDGTLGLDVFIAGTSYVAKVGSTGNYEISKVPAGKGYMLCVQKGEYTTIINEYLEVKAKETIEVGCKNLLSEDWAIENEAQTNPTFKWLGELATEPEDPDLYDAYYNTTDGCSYIWNGSDWDLLAKSGEDGVDGEDGKDGVNGTDGKDGVDGQSIVWKGALEAAPENPELYWAYYNTTDGCSYIWNGSSWDLLTQHANHTFNEWTVVTAPTSTTEGTSKRVCDICKFEETKQIIPIPEGFVFVYGGTIEGATNTNNYEGVFIEGRTVTLSDFYMGKYEVTQEEYASVMQGQKVTVNGTEYTLASDPSYCKEDSETYTLFSGDVQKKRPVEGVTWYDAVWYCNALSKKEGLTPAYDIEVTEVERHSVKTDYYIYKSTVTLVEKANGYRLPTEAEWEYAARGGDPTAADWNYTFSGAPTAEGSLYDDFGNSGLDTVGWYICNTATGTTVDSPVPEYGEQGYGTHQVGKKAPNRLGLYDMSGNVGEWCYDWYSSISTGKETDPTSDTSDYGRIFRGGAWYLRADSATVCKREASGGYCGNPGIGFRVVRPSSK